jgi:hypothetical protein
MKYGLKRFLGKIYIGAGIEFPMALTATQRVIIVSLSADVMAPTCFHFRPLLFYNVGQFVVKFYTVIVNLHL